MITRTKHVTTPNATPVAIFAFKPLLDNTAYKYVGSIVGFCPANGDAGGFDISFTLKRFSGTTTFVAAPVITAVKNNPAWNVTVLIIAPDQIVVSVIGDPTPRVVNWYGELSDIQQSA